MARKKTEEVQDMPVVEEVAVDNAVSTDAAVDTVTDDASAIEAPVDEKPKTRRGRKAKTEEPVDEKAEEAVESKVDDETVVIKYGNGTIIFPAHPDIDESIAKEEPVKEKKSTEVKASTSAQAIAKNNLYVLKVPGDLSTKLGNFKAGTKFTILEETKGWGKIAEGKWINLNYVEKV